MKCSEAELKTAAYIDKMLSAAELADFERHIAGCPSCRKFASDAAACAAGLSGMPALKMPADLYASISAEAKKRLAVKPWYVRLFPALVKPAAGFAVLALAVVTVYKTADRGPSPVQVNVRQAAGVLPAEPRGSISAEAVSEMLAVEARVRTPLNLAASDGVVRGAANPSGNNAAAAFSGMELKHIALDGRTLEILQRRSERIETLRYLLKAGLARTAAGGRIAVQKPELLTALDKAAVKEENEDREKLMDIYIEKAGVNNIPAGYRNSLMSEVFNAEKDGGK